MNFSYMLGHFGIEPMVNTAQEMVWIHQAFYNLCNNIANQLSHYRKWYITESMTMAIQNE